MLGEVIRKRRKELKMSQAELAAAIGLPGSQTYIGAIERGAHTNLEIETLRKLAYALDISYSELLKMAGMLPPGTLILESESVPPGLDSTFVSAVLEHGPKLNRERQAIILGLMRVLADEEPEDDAGQAAPVDQEAPADQPGENKPLSKRAARILGIKPKPEDGPVP